MTKIVKKNDNVININTLDIYDKGVDLHGCEKKIMLSFYRYASCPFCNLRMHEIMTKYDELSSLGLECIAIFESPRKSILKYSGSKSSPFPIIADPHREYYKLYAVEGSWFGVLTGSLNIGRFMKAIIKGHLPGKMEGDISMLPADFLIDENNKIYRAYYGKDITDHIPLDDVFSWVRN